MNLPLLRIPIFPQHQNFKVKIHPLPTLSNGNKPSACQLLGVSGHALCRESCCNPKLQLQDVIRVQRLWGVCCRAAPGSIGEYSLGLRV